MSIDPVTAGLISGGTQLVGNIAGGLMGINQARINRQFQLDMSSTAYQRAVADMRAAGLNPAMMFGGSGGAASTPGGSVAPGFNPADGVASAAMGAANAAADIAMKTANSAKIAQETKLAEEQTFNAYSQGQLNQLERMRLDQELRDKYQDDGSDWGKGSSAMTPYRRGLLLQLDKIDADIKATNARRTAIEEEGPERRFRNSPFGIGLGAAEQGSRVFSNIVPKLKLDLKRTGSPRDDGSSYGGVSSARQSQGYFDNKARPLAEGLGDMPSGD